MAQLLVVRAPSYVRQAVAEALTTICITNKI